MNVCFRFAVRDTTGSVADRLDTIAQSLASRTQEGKVLLYYHEKGRKRGDENPHYHGYLEGYNHTTNALRDWLRTNLKLTGKHDVSVKKATDKPIEYMSKGRLDPVVNLGFTQEYVDERKAQGYDGDAIASANAEKRKQKTLEEKIEAGNALTKWEMLQIMMSRMDVEEKRGLTTVKRRICPYTEPDLVLRVVITVLRENKQVIGEYKVKDYFDAIWAYDSPDSFISRMVKKIFPMDK